MNSRIISIPEKKFIGKKMQMSFSENKTFQLWNSFMPRRMEIKNSVSTELYSIEIYDPLFFKNFNPENEFEKWAALEVADFNFIPTEMQTIVTPPGNYAVFIHKGPASEGAKTYKFIFGSWLPDSDYELDDRPHFAVMGEKYKDNDPDSEEELWIPIRKEGLEY